MPEKTEKIRDVPEGATVHGFRRVDPLRLEDGPVPFVLVELSTVFGRDAGQSACVLDDPSVSRRHFVTRFAPRRRCFEVVDLDSSNGLFVNGVRVHEQVIAPDDVVRAGGQLLVFSQISEATVRQRGGRREVAFHGFSEAIRGVNDSLAGLPSGGRAVLWGEPGVGKTAAVRHVASRGGPSTRSIAVHGTSLRTDGWEGKLLEQLAAARSGREVVVHLDDVALAPVEAQERLLFLLREPELEAYGRLTVVATVSTRARTAAAAGLAPGLLHRLGPPFLHVPPLRQRRVDIVPTFVAALRRRGRVTAPRATAPFTEALLLHAWPGNADEVGALVDLLAAAGRLEACFDLPDLPGRLLPGADPESGATPDAKGLTEALRQACGNVSQAARQLGISRRHLYRLLEKRGLDPAIWRGARRSGTDPT